MVPDITVVGTTPTFYRIPITEDLAQHVAHGTYPTDPIRVTFCLPPVPRPASEGVKPLDNRRVILSCYEAFEMVIGGFLSSSHVIFFVGGFYTHERAPCSTEPYVAFVPIYCSAGPFVIG